MRERFFQIFAEVHSTGSMLNLNTIWDSRLHFFKFNKYKINFWSKNVLPFSELTHPQTFHTKLLFFPPRKWKNRFLLYFKLWILNWILWSGSGSAIQMRIGIQGLQKCGSGSETLLYGHWFHCRFTSLLVLWLNSSSICRATMHGNYNLHYIPYRKSPKFGHLFNFNHLFQPEIHFFQTCFTV